MDFGLKGKVILITGADSGIGRATASTFAGEGADLALLGVTENQSAGLPIVSLVCTCLGLNDFNQAIRDYHIERAKNVVDLAAEFASARNLCFVPGEYMFQKKLIPAKSEWDLVIDATRSGGQACG